MQFRPVGVLLLALVGLMMPAVTHAQTIDGGYNHTIAVLPNGTVLTWGKNTYGQLGQGDTMDRLTPTLVPGLSNIIAVGAGTYFSIALESNGTVWAWGHGSFVGDGTGLTRTSPVVALISNGVVAIATGESHSLAIDNLGNVWAWGQNGNGQLGDGTTTARPTPAISTLFGTAISISGSIGSSLVVRTDGTVWGSGTNSTGNLGDGTSGNGRLSPVQMTGVTGAVEVAAGSSHSLVRLNTGAVWGVGANGYGQLCASAPNRTLAASTGMTNAVSIAAGRDHSLARGTLGGLSLCGRNDQGMIGTGTATTGVYMVYSSSLSSVTGISGGAWYTAVMVGSNIWTWGSNSDGQLGDNTTTQRNSPVMVW
jgi:alpha-tubulin suppressor-like RCC1 family protein